MAQKNFDSYFANFPELDRERDFDSFWEKGISELKKIPIQSVLKKIKDKSTHRFAVYAAQFTSYPKTQVSGELFIPLNSPKSRIIIYIHDYNKKLLIPQKLLNPAVAYFFITLRGHSPVPRTDQQPDDTVIESPGFMVDNILNLQSYYLKGVYLDIYRSIDMLRLVSSLDCGKIGIIGKGLGAAAAIFTAAYSDRVAALVCETPSFCQLALSQNISESEAAAEINDFIQKTKGTKKQVKKNLTYFDSLNFSDKIKCPITVTVGFKDLSAPPECVFGLFNRIKSEKVMEVYPEEGNDAGGEKQLAKSISWVLKILEENL